MTSLFGRYVELRAGVPGQLGRSWKDLQIEFSVTKTLRKSSNKAEIRIYNLSDDSIGFLQQEGTVVDLLVGYENNYSLVFSGDVAKRGVYSERQTSGDLITSISAGDGETALRASRSDFSLSPGSTSLDAIRSLASTMGVGLGNALVVPPKVYLTGYVHSGLARDALDDIADDLGVRWSIQNGALQFLGTDAALPEVAVLLTNTTGLVGIPKRVKNGLEATSLLNNEIAPGKLVSVVSGTINAFYKVDEVTHAGSTRGNEFYSQLKARDL